MALSSKGYSMAVRQVVDSDDGFRIERHPQLGVDVIKRDFQPPVESGQVVALFFRVEGYEPDCDGSAMATLARLDEEGNTTGLRIDNIGLGYGAVVMDHPRELLELIQQQTIPPAHS